MGEALIILFSLMVLLWTFQYRHYASFNHGCCFIFLEKKKSHLAPHAKQAQRFCLNALSLYGQLSFSWKVTIETLLPSDSDYDAGRRLQDIALRCGGLVLEIH